MPASVRPSPANEVDYASGSLLTLAAVLCGAALFQSGDGSPRGFTWVAGVVALIFFASLIGYWLEPLQHRHGYVRATALIGATVLAGGGLAFTRDRPGLTLLCYWLPAVLAMGAVLLLARAHKHPDRDPLQVGVRARRRAEPRP